MSDITVIGSFVMDMVARVEEFPKPGQTVLGKSLRTYPGGKGANQCIAAARLGASIEMVGMLGDDGYGKLFLDLFKAEGVVTDNISVTKEEPTAIAQIQISDTSENKIVVIPSANFAFDKDNLKNVEQVISDTRLVVAQLELRPEINSGIIKKCHRLNTPLILNPAPAYKLSDEELGMVTYLTPNETELEILSGLPTDTEQNVILAAKKLLSLGVKNIIATLGKRGALIANADGVRIVAGYKVAVVDTVAAGDSFNGALAKCIVDGKSLDEAVRFANAVGALTVTKQGAIPSLPTLKEVREFLSKQ